MRSRRGRRPAAAAWSLCNLGVFLLFISVAVMPATAMPGSGPDGWTATTDIPLVSKWPRGKAIQSDNITADLFRSTREGRLPAAVIVNSSGGVTAHTELFYARLLASHGMAALVVDSFTPRGIRDTVGDQSQLRTAQSAADAAAGFRWLSAQPWVDPAKIVVLGMSKGGVAALTTATEADRRLYGITDIRFAAHVSIAPGCEFQNEDARTTGAPIFLMLSELDDYTPIQPCIEQADRMRSAGSTTVRLAVYPGVYHTMESVGGAVEITAERTKRCRVFRSGDRFLDRSTGKLVPAGQERAYIMKNCIDTGPVTVGGDGRVKAQAVADLLQFLRDVDIIEDREARAVVPDCASVAAGITRRNCERARQGWTGDLIALGRAYRSGKDVPRDESMAIRLFRLAAVRGDPVGQTQLALALGQGGDPKDRPEVLALARAAAEAGQPVAMNQMGVLLRDGIGTARNEAEAAQWFRRAALLRNAYSLAHLGEMYWSGRGGLERDRVEAVKLFRKSAYFENAWGRLYLARALETGEGTERKVEEAIALYRLVAAAEGEPVAKRRASEALARLDAQPGQNPVSAPAPVQNKATPPR